MDAAEEAERMTRIPRDTLIKWMTELSEWAPPHVFRARIDEMNSDIPWSTFFGQGGLTFLREAWIASRMADALKSDAVRLVSSERPDFELQIGGELQQFEATEADKKGRRRGDEPDDPSFRQDPVEAWRGRFEAIPEALDRVLNKKLTKDYPPGTNLAIYVNLGCYGAYLEEGMSVLRDHTAPARMKFNRVYVLWEGRLYKFWEQGENRYERWRYDCLSDF